MLKNTIKINRTKREQSRALLEKKLSKDSVTSTKFCDSSEDREEDSNSSNNINLNILKKSNNTKISNADNTDSFIRSSKSHLKSFSAKSNKKNSYKLNKVIELNKNNDIVSYNNIKQEHSKREGTNLGDSIIYDQIENNNFGVYSGKPQEGINNQIQSENQVVSNFKENNKIFLRKVADIPSGGNITNLSHITPSEKGNLINTENNLRSDIIVNNKLPYPYYDNKSNYLKNELDYCNIPDTFKSSSIIGANYNTTNLYNDSYLEAIHKESLKFFMNNNLNIHENNFNNYTNSLNPYTFGNYNNYNLPTYNNSNFSNNLSSATSNNFDLYGHNNSLIKEKFTAPHSNFNNIENKYKDIEAYNKPLNELYSNPHITNEMDFTNMYNSYTPIDNNNTKKVIDNSNYIINGSTSLPMSNLGASNFGITAPGNVYDNKINLDVYNNNSNDQHINANETKILEHINNESSNCMIKEPIVESENKLLKPTNTILENEMRKNDVTVSEQVSSHTDYSRATHSSHVVDKKIVHEGFETIKIPKYREVEIVEKIVEIPVVHKVNKYVNKYEIKEVEKVVKKPINKYVETKIEVPELHFQDKIVEVPELQEVVKIVEKEEVKERLVYKNKIETKIIPKYIEVPVIKIVNKYESYDDIGEVIKTVPVKKIVEIPNEVIKKVKIPIKKIIEEPNYVPIIKYRDIPIEKIRYVPKVQTIELVKNIPKIIDIPVPVKVPKIKIIDKPVFVNKYVDRPVVVPVSKTIKPIYKYEGKKVIEIPIHKPYIVTHDTIVPRYVENDMRNGRCEVYARRLDINSLNPIIRNELFNTVNKNNFNLQRSMSASNLLGNRKYIGDIFYSSNNINFNGINKIDSNTLLPNKYSKLNFDKKCDYAYNTGVRNNMRYAPGTMSRNNNIHANQNSNGLQFSKSLNNNNNNNIGIRNNVFFNFSKNICHSSNPIKGSNNSGIGIPMFNSNEIIVKGKNKSNVINGRDRSGLEINGFNSSNKLHSDNSGKNLNFNHNSQFNKSMGSNNYGYINDMANKFKNEEQLYKYQSDTRENIRSNGYRSMNNSNSIPPSRNLSPSVGSVDGISTYVVEYLGDDERKISDRSFTNELNNNMTENIGSNYSFSGDMRT
ncbi:inner membrane complex protein 1f, putative [Plasmodium berghei]|uniref:Inner membrane complex protein 1f, putative n=2 Tax=Plasmodium berghei TaxID=5821 RepID=A0A509ARP2_PLABA|nr:inner membrane complex protein 1f, putative [Plasmodium berghei ANKA]SCL98857.1 inner membrane complex protein 1f, putative [Plasmodium berghei]SCM16917.1 inner membrane complex protein 1f, putative [Plasmodium berghei]SCM18715.1 inner membrane complex protein 1f, putative [Plasmodium berghei]SCN28151.1 inner membrane complex protein 1f, putative [Plasmodium berghei]VUC58031.1 inner membrane complex protein 1f, putative [Plasmodium berghei ANKA]|eukprot:XP_034423800.1 inner membrane complex protein 1f, putative [Plasmodium berghei ANKA]